MSELGFQMQEETSKQKDPSKRGKGALGVALAIFVLSLLLVAGVFLREQLFGGGAEDYSGAGSGEVVIQVQDGQTLSAIGSTLKEEGVVASVQSFIDAAAANPQAQMIGPGYYRLAERMSAQEAINAMLDPANQVVSRVVIPEGLRLDQVVNRLAKGTELPPARFESALKRANNLGLPNFANGNPEGFLFPATYEFPPGADAADVIGAMLERFDQASSSLGLVRNAKKTGYSPYEVMVIASLVQAEGHPDDYGKVARVVYNRLAAGMPLQLDATVNYALRSSEINLSPDQIATASPYNTYQNTGLPPTPINQPGEAAIAAALEPEAGDWLYFVSVNPDTGETKFTSDYNEFLGFKREFEQYIADNP